MLAPVPKQRTEEAMMHFDRFVSVVGLWVFLACHGPTAEQGRAPEGDEARATVSAPAAETIERGRYLVSHVAACVDCHSPRQGKDGPFDRERWLSGIDCFVDAAPKDPKLGCLSTSNLTNHETGLKNRTDRQIKDMFLRGVRPDGKALHPFMPYAYLGNMSDDDANAIVAYLRTVKGVDRRAPSSQPPFVPPAKPVPRVPAAQIPMPRAEYPEQAAALRGRYLAASIGTCMNCHTPRGPKGPVFERAFEGGMKFNRADLGLSVGEQEFVYVPNITPHATGIRNYGVADIVRAVKHGEDMNQGGERLCPPMPAGPVGAFGGMTDADAADIAHYLLSLPPRASSMPYDCRRGEDP
jgi:mono/diheme cytochrome c family protein